MNEEPDIIQEYFEMISDCHSLNCQMVIFEPEERKEWFFDDDSWCYFEFTCDDNFYMLKRDDYKVFSDNCQIKDMSYEIKMLYGFSKLRNTRSIEKEMFTTYVNNYEKAKLSEPYLTIEKFNYDTKLKEDASLRKADKIANTIMGGCFIMSIFIAFLLLFALFSYLRARFF